MKTIANADIPKRAKKTGSVNLEENGIIYVRGDLSRRFLANATAMAAWDLIDGKTSTAEICEIITRISGQKAEQIKKDIVYIIGAFCELDLIKINSPN